MKLIKYLFYILATLLLLFVLVAVYFVATFDPNQYKDTIVSAVKQYTGRDLVIDEEIGFAFFPRLGIKVGGVSLSNAKGFKGDYFVQIDKANVNVDLLSILKGQVAADRIVLQGLSLNLVRNASGKTNWDDLSSKSSNKSPAAQKSYEDQGYMPVFGIEIAGISIIDAEVNYLDQQAGSSIRVAPFNLETGALASNRPTPIEIGIVMVQETGQASPPTEVQVNASTTATLNLEKAAYVFDDLSIVLEASGESLPGGVVELVVKGAMNVDTRQETLQLAPLRIDVQDTHLEGDLSMANFSNPVISFALKTEKLDLDAILPAAGGDAQKESAAAVKDDHIALPVAALRDLRINGSVNIDQLIMSGITATEVSVNVHAKDGLLGMNPIQLVLYEGKMLGQASLDVRNSTPKYAAKTELEGIEISQLMAALAEDGKAVIRGQSTVKLDIATQGDHVSGLKKALGGSLQFEAKDGALVNEKLARNVERVVAFLKGREPKSSGEELVFDSLTGTAQITRGVAANSDLDLKTPLIFGKGKGSVDIGESAMDYELRISLAEDATRSIPIRMRGPLDDLSYSVDLKAVLNDEQKQLVEEKKEEIKEKVDEKIKEKLGEGVGDKVGDKLKNLKLF